MLEFFLTNYIHVVQLWPTDCVIPNSGSQGVIVRTLIFILQQNCAIIFWVTTVQSTIVGLNDNYWYMYKTEITKVPACNLQNL